MPLRYYKNKISGETIRSLKKLDGDWEELICAPNHKFMISANSEKGKSKLKDATKILTERSRNHSRDVDLDNNIQINKANGLDAQVQKSFLNSKGERRRKIDDI